jgi:CheY-like chemotaxis protein
MFQDLFGVFDAPVDIATSGKQGLRMLKQTTYKLIFLDYKLGDITGAEVLDQIKQVSKKSKVVMISAHLTDDRVKELKKAGLDGFLYKPMDAQKIIGFARKYVDKKVFKG